MTAMTAEQERELRSILSEFAVAAPRASAALQGTTLLIEITAWMHVLAECSKRLLDLDLDLEVQATTAVQAINTIPGSVVVTDLDTLRAPDTLEGISP